MDNDILGIYDIRTKKKLKSVRDGVEGACRQIEGGEEGCALLIMDSRSRMSIDPRIPITPGRNTSGFHRPGSHCLYRARSAVRCSASRLKGELHPTKNR